jgi:alkylhydroperoxidase family enzyme
VKVLAGAVYGELARSRHIADDIAALATKHGVTRKDLSAAEALAGGRHLHDTEFDPATGAALILARAVASSPAALDDEVVAACAEHLRPDAIVEVVTWLAVLQLLHRLGSYTMLTEDGAPRTASGHPIDKGAADA